MDTRKTPLPCRVHDPELWFPTGTGPVAVSQEQIAKAYCSSCPIVAACLQRALDSGEAGVWGATSEQERRLMIRRGHRSMDSEQARRIIHRTLASA